METSAPKVSSAGSGACPGCDVALDGLDLGEKL
jgi:hypothetical protein